MSIKHNRPLPVAPERLKAVARMLYGETIVWPQRGVAPEVHQIALLGEQIELQQALLAALTKPEAGSAGE